MNTKSIERVHFQEIVEGMIRMNKMKEKYVNNPEELLIEIKDVVTQFREEILDVVNELMTNENQLRENQVKEKLIEDRNMSTIELSKFCGGVSRPTIDRWKESGLKHYKVNGRVFFRLSEVQEFLKSHQNK
jgi:predicted DNA-binding transcriptional regulator AlpA